MTTNARSFSKYGNTALAWNEISRILTGAATRPSHLQLQVFWSSEPHSGGTPETLQGLTLEERDEDTVFILSLMSGKKIALMKGKDDVAPATVLMFN